LAKFYAKGSDILPYATIAEAYWQTDGDNIADGELTSPLTEVGGAPDNRRGTSLRFWPDERYFDLPLIAVPTLKQVLRAKAVLCPSVRGSLDDQINGEKLIW